MKKIGILTFHRANNYGAVLQAYALQKILSGYYDAKVIDYRSQKIENKYHRKGIKYFIKVLLKMCNHPIITTGMIKKQNKFNDFREKNILLSSKFCQDNIKDANEKFDAFVVGSDQVWNNRITGDDWNYFLSFACPKKCFSYAASFGGDNIDLKQKDKIVSYLMKYNKILVREKSAFNILKKCNINKNKIYEVCDPVFLISKEEWIKKFNLKKNENRKYILVYCVAKGEKIFSFSKKLSIITGLDLLFLNLDDKFNIFTKEFKNIYDAGPLEFLNLIYNAEYVVTTSFHAMAFSLIFNIPFFYELNNEKINNNSRLINLSDIFDLTDMSINNFNNDFNFSKIDWKHINDKIEKYRKNSFDTLMDSINNLM